MTKSTQGRKVKVKAPRHASLSQLLSNKWNTFKAPRKLKLGQKKAKNGAFRSEERFLRAEWDGDVSFVSKAINRKTKRVLISVRIGKCVVATLLGQKKKNRPNQRCGVKHSEFDYEISYALVDKRVRGKGLGTTLVQLGLNVLFEKAKRVYLGAERIDKWDDEEDEWTHIKDSKSPVVNFWKRQGFKKVSLKELGDTSLEVCAFRMTSQTFKKNKRKSLVALVADIEKELSGKDIREKQLSVSSDIKVRINAPWSGDHFVTATTVKNGR